MDKELERSETALMDVVDRLPLFLREYIQTFIFPRAIDENFDVTLYPVLRRVETPHQLWRIARRANFKSPVIIYTRIEVKLSKRACYDLVCELDMLDIIDTLIFDRDLAYCHINHHRVALTNGRFQPRLKTKVSWFFLACIARHSRIEVKPCPRAVIGGFLNRRGAIHNRLSLKTGDYEYEYEYNSCIISKIM